MMEARANGLARRANSATVRPWTGTPRVHAYDDEEERLVGRALSVLAGYLARPGGAMVPAEMMHDYLRLTMHGLEYRRLDVLLFDRRGRLLAHLPVIRGSVDRLSVQPREVVRHARSLGAHSVVLAEWRCCWFGQVPGSAQIAASRYRDALDLCGLSLLGHYVVHPQNVAAAWEAPLDQRIRAPGAASLRVTPEERALVANANDVVARRLRPAWPEVKTPAQALAAARQRIDAVIGRSLCLLSLDENLRLVGFDVLTSTSPSSKDILFLALRHNASGVLLLDHDLCRAGYVCFDAARQLSAALEEVDLGIRLLDYLITDGRALMSWRADVDRVESRVV